jgi:hypothetical protein
MLERLRGTQATTKDGQSLSGNPKTEARMFPWWSCLTFQRVLTYYIVNSSVIKMNKKKKLHSSRASSCCKPSVWALV